MQVASVVLQHAVDSLAETIGLVVVRPRAGDDLQRAGGPRAGPQMSLAILGQRDDVFTRALADVVGSQRGAVESREAGAEGSDPDRSVMRAMERDDVIVIQTVGGRESPRIGWKTMRPVRAGLVAIGRWHEREKTGTVSNPQSAARFPNQRGDVVVTSGRMNLIVRQSAIRRAANHAEPGADPQLAR